MHGETAKSAEKFHDVHIELYLISVPASNESSIVSNASGF